MSRPYSNSTTGTRLHDKTTHGLRVLGDGQNQGGMDESLYLEPPPRSTQAYGGNAWQFSPQFAMFNEVEGLVKPQHYAVSAPNRQLPVVSRLLAILKRLVIPIAVAGVLLLLASVVSPALAREARTIGRGPTRASGYMEQSQGMTQAQGNVPIIDAQSDPQGQPQPTDPVTQPARPSASGVAYDLVAAPSLSVAQIERVLTEYDSPAAGKGQHLYDLGVRYGLDPAYALAFFVVESGCGTKGVARSTHSLGNIRWTEGYANFSGYRKYATWEAGMEDWYKLITELYIGGWNLRTVDKILPVYAPWGDNNNPDSYASSVKRLVDSWRGK